MSVGDASGDVASQEDEEKERRRKVSGKGRLWVRRPGVTMESVAISLSAEVRSFCTGRAILVGSSRWKNDAVDERGIMIMIFLDERSGTVCEQLIPRAVINYRRGRDIFTSA